MTSGEKEYMFALADDLLISNWKIKRANIWTTSKSYGTVYKINIKYNFPAAGLFREILEGTNQNPLVLESLQIGRVDYQTDIIRVKTAPSKCGFVESRELVNLRSWQQRAESFLIVARSINAKNLKEKNEIMVWHIKYDSPNTCSLDFIMCFKLNTTIDISYIFFKAYIKHLKQLVPSS